MSYGRARLTVSGVACAATRARRPPALVRGGPARATEPIGLVGLGIMGKPMARNLLKAGHKLVVYEIVPAALDEIMSEGAEGARSAKEVGEKCDFVITMVPNSPHVKAAIFGENGVADGIKSGSLIVDMSSIDP